MEEEEVVLFKFKTCFHRKSQSNLLITIKNKT